MFKEFKVKLSENLRHFEDDDTGFEIRKGKPSTVYEKHFRSRELKFLMLRNKILVDEGECEFPFRGDLIKIKPGKNNKNIIITNGISDEVKEKVLEIKNEETFKNPEIPDKKEAEVKPIKKKK